MRVPTPVLSINLLQISSAACDRQARFALLKTPKTNGFESLIAQSLPGKQQVKPALHVD